jgi:hypothetical protein
LIEHDLFGKPASTFPDHALDGCLAGPSLHRRSAIGLAQERRRNVAAVRREAVEKVEIGPPPSRRPARAPGRCKRAGVDEKIVVFSSPDRISFASGRLTIKPAEAYIRRLGRAAAWRDGASAKPLTVHTVTEHPAMISWPCSRRRVGCAGLCASGSYRGRTRNDGAARLRAV